MKDYGWHFVAWILVSLALISFFDGQLRDKLKENASIQNAIKY